MAYQQPPRPSAIKPIDYEGFGQSVRSSLKSIGSNIEKAGELAKGAYSEHKFRQYQKQAIADLKKGAGDGWQDMADPSYMNPERTLKGIKNSRMLQAAYDAAVSSGVSPKVAKGTMASLAFYGDEGDVKTLYDGLTKDMDEVKKKQVRDAANKAYSDLARSLTPEQLKNPVMANREFAGTGADVEPEFREKSLQEIPKAALRQQEIDADIRQAGIRAAATRSKGAEDKAAELAHKSWADVDKEEAKLVSQKANLESKAASKGMTIEQILNSSDSDPETKKDKEEIKVINDRLKDIEYVRNIGARDGYQKPATFARQERAMWKKDWDDTSMQYEEARKNSTTPRPAWNQLLPEQQNAFIKVYREKKSK